MLVVTKITILVISLIIELSSESISLKNVDQNSAHNSPPNI